MDAIALLARVRLISEQLREEDCEADAKRLEFAAEANLLPTEIFLEVYEELVQLIHSRPSDSAARKSVEELKDSIRLELKQSGFHLR